jgi:hypothetical protein
MLTRDIPKQFHVERDFGYKNLIVSGCSFTYNNADSVAVTWPYYLRDIGNFDEVYDCSLPGAGNTHIKNSIISCLDNNPHLLGDQSLLLVCWSGNNRDDHIVSPKALGEYPFEYYYADGASLALSGGADGNGNLKDDTIISKLRICKDTKSRAWENYIAIRSLYTYLSYMQIKFVFFEYRDHNLPARDRSFDLTKYLESHTKKLYNDMIHKWSTDIYSYSIRRDMLMGDDFHPNPDAHLSYTKEILVPELWKYLGNK